MDTRGFKRTTAFIFSSCAHCCFGKEWKDKLMYISPRKS